MTFGSQIALHVSNLHGNPEGTYFVVIVITAQLVLWNYLHDTLQESRCHNIECDQVYTATKYITTRDNIYSENIIIPGLIIWYQYILHVCM